MQKTKHNLNEMICLDIFLNSLSYEEYQEKKPFLRDFQDYGFPIISAEFHIKNLNSFPLKEDVITLYNFRAAFNWQNNIKSILEEKDYEAIVLTDATESIVWVNDGFSEMTGYSKNDAINKTPDFLQGRKTDISVKRNIRKQLDSHKPFKEVILNYKKDGTPYKCEIHVFPLQHKNKTTHFLALERKAS